METYKTEENTRKLTKICRVPINNAKNTEVEGSRLANEFFLLGGAEKMSGVYSTKTKVRGMHAWIVGVTTWLEPLTTN